MSISEATGSLPDRIPLSVITARETVTNNPWINERWKVVGVIAGRGTEGGQITRSVLRVSPDSEQYLWSGFVLVLRPSEADAYYYNIIGQNPSLYVYCEHDDVGEPRPRSVTAEYIEALAHAEVGNSVFNAPMPPEIYRIIEQYVLVHYEPEEPKMKRKHERDANRAGVWDDE